MDCIIRNYRHLIIGVLATLMMTLNTSCGDEPDGCEADIETVTLHVSSPERFFF